MYRNKVEYLYKRYLFPDLLVKYIDSISYSSRLKINNIHLSLVFHN